MSVGNEDGCLKDILWDLDQGSEKVFERPFRQTMVEQASMCEWSSCPAGREKGFPCNFATELKKQNCLECPHTSQSLFPNTVTKTPMPNHENHNHITKPRLIHKTSG
ncbi:hypothetical protein TNCV_3283801 [Trichonephila clavipes]|nr:hypothetical protein TNCV_3283801 [Trichonephila clavipes]